MGIVVYQDYLRAGGTESQSIYLASGLEKKGETVWLLTNRPGGRLCAVVEEHDLRHQSLQIRDIHLNWYAPGLTQRLKKFNPDLVILMGRNANSKGKLIRRVFPDLTIIGSVRTGRTLPRQYRESLAVANAVFCNSQWAADRLNAIGIPLHHIEVHPNACLRAREIEAALSPQTCREKRVHLVYVAAFVPGKNHRSLIGMLPALVQQIPSLKLHLVGEGPLLQKMKAVVAGKRLENCVVFEGYRKDLQHVFCEADLAISPSLEESMPNALVEAQYAGLPVVAYDVAGVRECFVPDLSGMLVPPGDEAAFVHAIVNLLKDVDRRQSMKEAAIHHARHQFDPDVRFDAFYQSVLKYVSNT